MNQQQIIEIGKALLPYLRTDLTSAELGTASHNAAAALNRASNAREPISWFAETGTAGVGEGCNKPFWLKHEAIEYVQKHGGHIKPLFDQA